MPKVFDAVKLTKRSYTPEGYLIAPAVLAKAGTLQYYAHELELTDRAPSVKVNVYRSKEELAKSVPSFEHKPITMDHPPEGVDASTWRELAVGDVYDVLTEDDAMHATAIIRDKQAIEEINKKRRELSNGYRFELRKVQGKSYEFEQVDIQGNHIAIVDRARCGPSCVLGDRDPITTEPDKEKKRMVRLMMDGYPPEVDENTAALVITRLQKEQRDQAEKFGKDIAELQATLKKPAKIAIGDSLCDSAQVAAMLEERDNKIKALQQQVMTPEKAREEYRAQQKLIATVKDMLPKMEISENVDSRTLCLDTLRQLSEASPAARAQINAVLDGVRLDDAKDDALARAVRTVHATQQVDKDRKDARSRNTDIGRSVFDTTTGYDTPQKDLSGRDAYVQRLEHMMQEGESSLEEL